MLIKEIVKAVNGILMNGDENLEIHSFSKDTRTIEQGAFYIPIIGESFDGHDFIDKAYQNGAIACFCSRKNVSNNPNIIYVDDTLLALQTLAKYHREQSNCKVVAITGSVGKTSTKDMIYSVVSTKYKALKTIGNYNNEIGLPLTILRMKDEEVLVLEMGMNKANEISLLSHIASPDICVITNVGTAHIGNLGSRENILKAKLEIVNFINDQGCLIINNDNDLLHDYYLNNKGKTHFDLISYGTSHASMIKAKQVQLSSEASSFKYNEGLYQVNVPGIHFVSNALSAIAVGKALNIDEEDIKKGICNFELTKGRADTYILNNGVILLDGTYNANVDSMKASLSVLSSYQDKRTICVLADMLELGEYSESLHKEVGKAVNDLKIDTLICVGELSKLIIEGAKDLKNKYWFDSNEAVSAFLIDYLGEFDVLLIKGSNSMKLKEIVFKLKEAIGNG